jgi:hypothetical protein
MSTEQTKALPSMIRIDYTNSLSSMSLLLSIAWCLAVVILPFCCTTSTARQTDAEEGEQKDKRWTIDLGWIYEKLIGVDNGGMGCVR